MRDGICVVLCYGRASKNKQTKKVTSPMKSLLTITLSAVVALAAYPLSAETINIGRSDVELIVPDSYSQDSKTPLVVLLHGYTSSGARQESYMKFGELVNEFNNTG